MGSSIMVPLPPDVREALIRLALRELRHPRQQASKMLSEAVRREIQRLGEPSEVERASS